MKATTRLEKLLRRILPLAIFSFLVRCYQTAKREWNGLRYASEARRYVASAYTNPETKKIIDLDMYGWTGVDITGHLAEKFGDQVAVLKNTVSWDDYEKDNFSVSAATRDNYWKLSHKNLLLWELAKVSITKHLGKIIIPGESALGDEDIECINRYYQWTVNCYEVVNRILDKYRPDYMLLTQGGVYDSRVFAELARRKNIKAVAAENSLSSDHFYVDSVSGQILNRHSIALVGSFITECESLEFEQAEAAVISFFNSAISNKETDHRTTDDVNPGKLRVHLGIPENRKIILFLGQVRTDASTVLDSTLYPEPVFLIKELIKIAAENEDYFLVVRLHPKEDTHDRVPAHRNHQELCHNATLNELTRLGIGNTSNVRIIADRSINTYSLMKMSNLGITINSQSGLEMALLGLPVITAGRCFYANKGFTWDVSHPSMLEPTIKQAVNSIRTEKEKQALIRFCHYLFFNYLVSKGLTDNIDRLYRIFGLTL